MNTPLVTVFMPVYNSEQYIKESLDSIINQTYQNLEILLVDDGSTDRSVEIIKSYKDERIRLIQNRKNRGIPYTRNVGLKEASGEYIAIMDSDDIAVPNRIERQVQYLETNKKIDAIGSFYIKFGGKFEKRVQSRFTAPEEIKAMLLFYNPIANPSVTLRKSTLLKNNLTYHLDFFVAQDYQMWAQLIKVGNIAILPEYLLKYRFGHENISKISNRDRVVRRKKLIDAIHEDLIKYYNIPLNKEEIEVFNDFFTESYGGAIQDVQTLTNVIRKLKVWNEQKKVFEQDIFLEVLDFCIFFAINHQKLPAAKKICIYQSLVNKGNLKDQASILAKHYYYRLRKII